MKWFKRKYDKGPDSRTLAGTRVADRIALWMSKLQKAFANYMDKKINPLSLKRKKLMLYGFCCLVSLYCLWLILSPFAGQRKNDIVKVQPIQLPEPQHREREALNSNGFISTDQYNKIHAFKLYLDSLAGNKKGSVIYDSIIAVHPGIMDSLKLIEEYYQLQK